MEEEEREAERERLRRRRETMKEKEREAERERLRRRREAMEEEEREAERERLRRRREAMEEEEREAERERHQLRRALQSPETTFTRRQSDRVRQQQRRASIPAPTTANVGIYLGSMTTVCPHCRALRFPRETLNCCHNGKVSLSALAACPQPLKDLFTGTSNEARNFRGNIRQYNSAFAFASFGAQTVQVSDCR